MPDVLIVGAGPVGLSLAVELGLRGISCRVVERNDRVGYSPRAKTTNVRSREHLRRWGIADTLRKASPIPPDYPPDVVFATRMNGPALARFDNCFNGRRERNEFYSEEAQWVPQYTVEEVLRARAVALPGVEVMFQTELMSFAQDDDGVTAQLRDLASGTTTTVRSAYLVGADGARSSVRAAIGAKMSGSSDVAKNYSIICRAPDLAARQIHGDAIMYWMVNNDSPALFGPMDQHGLWFIMVAKLPGGVDPASVDPIDLIRRAAGFDDLAVEIVRSDPWIAHSLVADKYADRRAFLAGDACHLHPPFGGFGMNMGIGDAVDLGWKLAATLQGWGGPGLLDSYQTERRPVHERTIQESIINYATLGGEFVRPDIEDAGHAGDAARQAVGDLIRATKDREFYTLGLVLGARYENAPTIISDGSQPPPEHFMDYQPSAFPGCLAPHAWLADGTSLYDHFGAGFTLLVTDGTTPDTGGTPDAGGIPNTGDLSQIAERRRLPLTVLAPHDARLPALYAARFALIRPDQHVAWRGDRLPDDSTELLAQVTGWT